MSGAGRKKLQINEQVYPILKEEMLKIARLGGDTTRRTPCEKYREIALNLKFEEMDIPEEVKGERMQRFDKVLNFSLRATNQTKSNRMDKYEIDRLSRYFMDLLRQNTQFACKILEA